VTASGERAGAEGDGFPVRLSRAIEARGLSLERLSAHLTERGAECSPSAISLWSNGRARPRRLESLHVLHQLEQILGTPPGHLTNAPHPPLAGSSEWWDRTAHPGEVLHEGGQFARASASLGMAENTELQRLAVIEIASIDAQRRFCGTSCQMVVQAARDDAERMAIATYTVGSALAAGGLRLVQPLEGARLGRRRVERETGQVISELILDAPLRRGERHVVSYRVVPSAGPEPATPDWGHHELRSARPIAQLVLGVDFAPDALPQRVEVVEDPRDGAGEDGQRRELVLQVDRALISRSTLPHGGARIEWTWEER
jgi:transcriptional regulator with XRE-family HTH domain